MADGTPAIEKVIGLEGDRFTDDPVDRGGATKYGLTLRFLQRMDATWTRERLQQLERPQAVDLYRKYIWEPSGVARITDQDLANEVFEMIVNMGTGQGVKILQRALNFFTADMVSVDGVLGPATAAAANQTDPKQLLQVLQMEAVRFYFALVKKDPSQKKWFLGWIARVIA